MRFVLDTNTLVSAFLWKGVPANLLLILRSGKHTVYSSEILLSELKEVLKRPKFQSQLVKVNQTPIRIINGWLDLIEVVNVNTLPKQVSRDVDDDAVLACALASNADYIISGDNDLLVLKGFEGIPILTAAQALEILQLT
jgi:uncharacterized protein